MFRASLILAALGFLSAPILAQLPTETQNFEVNPPDWKGRLNRVPESGIDFGWDDGSGEKFKSANINICRFKFWCADIQKYLNSEYLYLKIFKFQISPKTGSFL